MPEVEFTIDTATGELQMHVQGVRPDTPLRKLRPRSWAEKRARDSGVARQMGITDRDSPTYVKEETSFEAPHLLAGFGIQRIEAALDPVLAAGHSSEDETVDLAVRTGDAVAVSKILPSPATTPRLIQPQQIVDLWHVGSCRERRVGVNPFSTKRVTQGERGRSTRPPTLSY